MGAAFLLGGIWAPGHDFIVNRFTGETIFVPSEESGEEQTGLPTHAALTAFRADGRLHALRRR